jgi:hypothetical protein
VDGPGGRALAPTEKGITGLYSVLLPDQVLDRDDQGELQHYRLPARMNHVHSAGVYSF